MKTSYLSTICLLALGIATGCSKSAKPGPSGQSQFTDAQVLEEFGWFVGKRTPLREVDPTKAEYAAFMKGFQAATDGKPDPYNLELVGPRIDQLINTRVIRKNNADETAYFAKLKGIKGVVETPSGLRYEILKQGDGPAPKATDTVKVNYKGSLIDGTEFDSSYKRGEPASFALNGVIPAWTEGLQKLNKGGSMKLHVPAKLGYGDSGNPNIPPGSTLIFELELLDIVSGAPAPVPAVR